MFKAYNKKYSTYSDKYYWKPYFWSRSYCLISTGGSLKL
ncbi:transposase [Borreliella burgdorferi]